MPEIKDPASFFSLLEEDHLPMSVGAHNGGIVLHVSDLFPVGDEYPERDVFIANPSSALAAELVDAIMRQRRVRVNGYTIDWPSRSGHYPNILAKSISVIVDD